MIARLQAQWLALSGNLRAALWVTLAAIAFAANDAAVKFLGKEINPVQMAMMRYWIGLVLMAPLLYRAGWDSIKTTRLGLHMWRMVLAAGAQICVFYAVIHLLLADATAIAFSRPLFLTALAVLLLGERVGWKLWLATAVGFGGVVMMVRPGQGPVELAAMAAVLGAILFAWTSIHIRKLARTDSPLQILFYYYAGSAVLTSIAMIWLWKSPADWQWPLLLAIGILSTLGMTCMVRGFSIGALSIAAPMEYTRLVYAALIGFYLFAEVPDIWTYVGAAIIIGSAFYIARQEAARKPGGG